jgi:hypothetical protein
MVMPMMTDTEMANALMAVVTNEALKMPFGTMGVMGDGAVIQGESSMASRQWSGLVGLEIEVGSDADGAVSVSASGGRTATANAKFGKEARSVVYRRGRRIFVRLVAYLPATVARIQAHGRQPRRGRRARQVAGTASATGDPPPPAGRHAPFDLGEGGRP